LVVASSGNAALILSVEAGGKNIANVDPVTFGPAPPVDEYRVALLNSGDVAVSALQLRFEGNFVNNNTASGVSFSARTTFQSITAPFSLADSFFVAPLGEFGTFLPAPGQTIDNGSVLAATYTLSGPPRLIPAFSTRTVAVLAVPAGSPPPGYHTLTYGAAIIGDELVVFKAPEPTTCVLAGLALVGAAARRRR
jgi:hypothetical protein